MVHTHTHTHTHTHKILKKEKGGRGELWLQRKKKAMRQWKQEAAVIQRRGYKSRNPRGLQKPSIAKTGKWLLPPENSGKPFPAHTLTGTQGSWFQTSGFQSCKRIHVCCLKSSDWYNAKLVQTCMLKAINLQTVSQGMFSFSTETELPCNIILVAGVQHGESIFW